MAAYGWYEDKAVGLGTEFLRGFYAHAATLQRTPLISPKVHQDFRRGLLLRFPYACYYRVEGEFVIVYDAFHCARDPSTVNESLGIRRER
jgi:hypothetical protein